MRTGCVGKAIPGVDAVDVVEIAEAAARNLRRCTGHESIFDAVRLAREKLRPLGGGADG